MLRNNAYMYENFMKKRNLIFPLVVSSSLFIPSVEPLERTADFNSLENENNIAIDILIAEGSSGGGTKSKEQTKNIEKNKEKAKEAAKKRIKAKESKDAEREEKIAISKLDDVGTSFKGGVIRDKMKELTAKVAIASVSNISAKVVKLQDEFKNYNAKSIGDRFRKYDEIALKIAALEDLQKEIDDFLNLNIDSMVYCIKFMYDTINPSIDRAEIPKKHQIYIDNYHSLWAKAKAAGILNNEFKKAFEDIYKLGSLQFFNFRFGYY